MFCCGYRTRRRWSFGAPSRLRYCTRARCASTARPATLSRRVRCLPKCMGPRYAWACPGITGEAAAPERRIDFGDGRMPSWNLPAVERPEMHALPKPLANEAQPGNPGTGVFGDRSLHVEMKEGFSRCLHAPRSIAAREHMRAVAEGIVANKIDVIIIDVDVLVVLPVHPSGLQSLDFFVRPDP
jgi:hypothetical protein